MKKKSTLQSAFFNRRILIGFVCCLAAVFVALVSFGQSRGSAGRADRSSFSVTESPNVNPHADTNAVMTYAVANTNHSGAGPLVTSWLCRTRLLRRAGATNLIQLDMGAAARTPLLRGAVSISA
jgi:hypothetical protein